MWSRRDGDARREGARRRRRRQGRPGRRIRAVSLSVACGAVRDPARSARTAVRGEATEGATHAGPAIRWRCGAARLRGGRAGREPPVGVRHFPPPPQYCTWLRVALKLQGCPAPPNVAVTHCSVCVSHVNPVQKEQSSWSSSGTCRLAGVWHVPARRAEVAPMHSVPTAHGWSSRRRGRPWPARQRDGVADVPGAAGAELRARGDLAAGVRRMTRKRRRGQWRRSRSGIARQKRMRFPPQSARNLLALGRWVLVEHVVVAVPVGDACAQASIAPGGLPGRKARRWWRGRRPSSTASHVVRSP